MTRSRKTPANSTAPCAALVVGDCSPSSVPKLPDAAFIPNHSAESNHVFLWTHCEQPPFMRAVPGWKIVGYGNAPWPKKDWPLAVMFERTEPPTNPYGNTHGDEMKEGTRIWQHGREEWVPGQPGYEGRMRKANAEVSDARKPAVQSHKASPARSL